MSSEFTARMCSVFSHVVNNNILLFNVLCVTLQSQTHRRRHCLRQSLPKIGGSGTHVTDHAEALLQTPPGASTNLNTQQ